LINISFKVTLSNANNLFWNDIKEPIVLQNVKRDIVPQKYRSIELDLEKFSNLLNTAPNEFPFGIAPKQTIVELPKPEGGFEKFVITKSQIMENELSEKFPTIKTYSGQGLDDKTANVKIDLTAFGFHAMIRSAKGTWFIDPYSKANTTQYISYYKRDYFNKDKSMFEEDLLIVNKKSVINKSLPPAAVCIGDKLRTYRLDVACTGEYAQAVAGANATIAQVLSAIITTVNRVNGVYETELAIRFVLIANETSIIFVNPSTDPFNGNNSPNVLINESQNVINSTIQNLNYDIGHTFSTGGGGLANLGCVCDAGSKANGVTGSSNPVGDPYDIDYVAHEIGHQFGANHTFNSSLGSCSGNRNFSTAYEVGSGTTIMAYAGICSADNIQPNSDAFFHTTSYDEIINYAYLDAGNSCPVITNTGNSAPTLTMPESDKAVPKQTPFMLTAQGEDPDGDAITFCWEEMDNGPATTWNGGVNNINSPLFKSREPSTSPTRTFPSLAVIRANYPTNPNATMGGLKGETLPLNGRPMYFRLTVRDNKVGGGGVATAGEGCFSSNPFSVVVVDEAGPFKELIPNGGEQWTGATYENITWDVANTNTGFVNCANVDILYSIDGGVTFVDTLISNVPNNGSILAKLPNIQTNNNVRLMIKCSDNYFFDITDNNFTITFNPNPSAINDINKLSSKLNVYPNPAKNDLKLMFSENSLQLNLNYCIINSIGKEVLNGKINNKKNEEIDLNISSLSKGIYYIKTYNDSYSNSCKFIKE
jgi:hypothetical protein